MQKGTTNRNELLTSAMAAKELGFSQDYVRRLLIEGKIKAEKIGRDWVITRRALSRIKRQRKASCEPE